MKKGIILTIIVVLISALICGIVAINISEKHNESEITNVVNNENVTDKKIAVIYFSATGNTRKVANYIKDETNANINEIIPKERYTADDIDYGDDKRAAREQSDKNIRPQIEKNIDVSGYETIFLGYPIWYGYAPRIIQTFVETHDLAGKTIIPFCTSDNSEIEESENIIKLNTENINWIKGKKFNANSSKEEIKNWIDSLILDNKELVKSDNEFIIEVNNKELTVEMEENSSSKALIEKLKEENIVVNAHDYSNFEKVGELGFTLPRNDENITTKAGDLILYQGNQIALYYDTNTWTFTKLGKVTNVSDTELKNILGDGNVTMTLKLK